MLSVRLEGIRRRRSHTPVRAGYTLTGWNTKADGAGSAFDFSKPVTYSPTVYTQWKQNAADPGSDTAGDDANTLTGNAIAWPVGIAADLTLLASGPVLTRRLRRNNGQ